MIYLGCDLVSPNFWTRRVIDLAWANYLKREVTSFLPLGGKSKKTNKKGYTAWLHPVKMLLAA